MAKPYTINPKVVHFIGIGGIGMSALARYFLSENWSVSGSDLSPSSITDELKKEGARIHIGKHSPNNLPREAKLIVYSQAISRDNPELKTASKLKIQAKSYPEVIGELTRRYKTIAIAGAHGKSTTTAMTALILIEAGFNPTVIVGTKTNLTSSQDVKSNFRKGKSQWLVLEADEWKASFLNYSPFIGAITNIDKEHLDFYKNFANVKKAFAQFKKQCQCFVKATADLKIKSAIKKVLKVPGEHNVQNALLAYSVGKHLDISDKIILRALGKYTGAWRRMEFRGSLKIDNCKLKIPVYDDYAHHPTEIAATLAGMRQWLSPKGAALRLNSRLGPKSPLICVFQAHQLERLKLLYDSFKTAFKEADEVIILPTFEVAGRERKSKISTPTTRTRQGRWQSSKSKKDLSEKLAQDIGADYLENPRKLKSHLSKILLASGYTLSPILVMMGAGDIVKYTDNLLSQQL